MAGVGRRTASVAPFSLAARGYAPSAYHVEGGTVSTLAFQFEEINARELKPELYELDGISRAAVEAHYKLYEGYVNKRNEILRELDGIDLASANQVYSDIRSLKVDLSFA